MVRVKVSSILSLSGNDFREKVQSVVDNISNSPSFPNPSPTTQDMENACDQLELLENESEDGDRTIIAQKRTALGTLQGLFRALCIWVGFTVRNAANAEDLINSIGLEVAKTGGRPVANIPVPTTVKSEVGDPHCVDISWQCDRRGVHSYVVEITDTADTANAVWRMLATTTVKKCTASGLERGKFYSFRIRCVGAKSVYGGISETTTCMAG